MRTSAKTRYYFLVALLAAAALMLACSLLTDLGSKPTSEVGSTSEGAEEGTPVSEGADEDDPIDLLLDLRSVRISLAADYPDGSSESQVVEIDSAGNMHATISLPPPDPDFVPEGLDVSEVVTTSYELYVIDGKAYQPSELDPAWSTTPADEDYLATLANELHSPSGPGLWLDILPEGSVTEDGSETVGGFACDRYKVNGTVGDQAITGTIWVDPEAFALIKAELHVPAALLAATDESTTGELKVTLNVEKADVPAVQLPAAP